LKAVEEQPGLCGGEWMRSDHAEEEETAGMRVSGAQIRAARKLLRWPAVRLSIESKASLTIIQRWENDRGDPRKVIQARILQALEAAGVEFMKGGHRSGVKLKGGDVEMKPTKSASDLRAIVMERLRKHADCSVVHSVVIIPGRRTASHPANWEAGFVTDAAALIPARAREVGHQVAMEFDLAP
jgi:hypothetical protein